MNGDLLTLLDDLAKLVFGVLEALSGIDLGFRRQSGGSRLEKPARLIPCSLWTAGPFLAIGVGHPMNTLGTAAAAALLGLGISALLVITWDDAPKTIGTIMWGGATLCIAAALISVARLLTHAAPVSAAFFDAASAISMVT